MFASIADLENRRDKYAQAVNVLTYIRDFGLEKAIAKYKPKKAVDLPGVKPVMTVPVIPKEQANPLKPTSIDTAKVKADDMETRNKLAETLKNLVERMKSKITGLTKLEELVPVQIVQDFAEDLHEFAVIVNGNAFLQEVLKKYTEFWTDDKTGVKETFSVLVGKQERLIFKGKNSNSTDNGYLITRSTKLLYNSNYLFLNYAKHVFLVHAAFLACKGLESANMDQYKKMHEKLISPTSGAFFATSTQLKVYKLYLESVVKTTPEALVDMESKIFMKGQLFDI